MPQLAHGLKSWNSEPCLFVCLSAFLCARLSFCLGLPGPAYANANPMAVQNRPLSPGHSQFARGKFNL